MSLQSERTIAVASPLGTDVLLFRKMSMPKTLGRPFVVHLDLYSRDDAICCQHPQVDVPVGRSDLGRVRGTGDRADPVMAPR